MEVKRYGTEYGGFYYPVSVESELNSDSIIYCVGVGEDVSHDIVLANITNANIYLFDPTPRAIQHVELVKKILNGDVNSSDYNNNKFGGGDLNYWNFIKNHKIDINKINFYPYGLHDKDDIVKFYKPKNTNHVSCSINKDIEHINQQDYFLVNVKKLSTIMNELKHEKIDLLKMDIEGTECDVLDNMIEDNIKPKYLAVEFDIVKSKNGNVRESETVQKLINYGYKLIKRAKNNITFYYNGN